MYEEHDSRTHGIASKSGIDAQLPLGDGVKLALKFLAIVIIALVLGVGSALLYLRTIGLGDSIAVGPWKTSTAIGSTKADLYTRASVAVAGLLALNRSETIYFNASSDDEGDSLLTGCTYKISGEDPTAHWWSITLYGADHFLVANEKNIYSYGGNSVKREVDGSFVITVSPHKTANNWLPTGNLSGAIGEPFALTMRLYNPDKAFAEDPSGITLPKIEKEACPS